MNKFGNRVTGISKKNKQTYIFRQSGGSPFAYKVCQFYKEAFLNYLVKQASESVRTGANYIFICSLSLFDEITMFLK